MKRNVKLLLAQISLIISCFLIASCQEASGPAFSANVTGDLFVNSANSKFNGKFGTSLYFAPIEFQNKIVAAVKAQTATGDDQPYLDVATLKASLPDLYKASLRQAAQYCSRESKQIKESHACIWPLIARVFSKDEDARENMRKKLVATVDAFNERDKCLSKFITDIKANTRLRLYLQTKANLAQAAVTVEGETYFKFTEEEAKNFVGGFLEYYECGKKVDPIELSIELVRESLGQCSANEAVSMKDELKKSCQCVTAKKLLDGEVEASTLLSFDGMFSNFNTTDTQLKAKVDAAVSANNYDNVSSADLTKYLAENGASISNDTRTKVQAALQAKISAGLNANSGGNNRNLQNADASAYLNLQTRQELDNYLNEMGINDESQKQLIINAWEAAHNTGVEAQTGIFQNLTASLNSTNSLGDGNCALPVKPNKDYVAKYCDFSEGDLAKINAKLEVSNTLRFLQSAQLGANADLTIEQMQQIAQDINKNSMEILANSNSNLADTLGNIFAGLGNFTNTLLDNLGGAAALMAAYKNHAFNETSDAQLQAFIGLNNNEIVTLFSTDGMPPDFSPKCYQAVGRGCGTDNLLRRLRAMKNSFKLPAECDYVALGVSKDNSTFINNCLFYFQKVHMANSIQLKWDTICQPLQRVDSVRTLAKITQGMNVNLQVDLGGRRLEDTQIVYTGNDPTGGSDTQTNDSSYNPSDDDVAIDGSNPSTKADSEAYASNVQAKGEAEVSANAYADLTNDYSFARYIVMSLLGLLLFGLI